MNIEQRYTTNTIRQSNGQLRHVYTPSNELRAEQRAVRGSARAAGVEQYIPYAHGGIRGRSPLTNASQHLGAREFYKLDLWHAYQNVKTPYLKQMATVVLSHLTEVAGPLEVDDIIDTTVTAPDIEGLPTGFATSPLFYNIYCMLLDTNLASLSAENGLTYTRYVDDLTFSGPRHVFASKALRRKIRQTIYDQPGGSIRDSKARIEAIHRGVTITGISLTEDPEYIYPAKELLQGVDRYITYCEEKCHAGERLALHELDKLRGYNGVLHMAGHPEESKSTYVRNLYDRYQSIITLNQLFART